MLAMYLLLTQFLGFQLGLKHYNYRTFLFSAFLLPLFEVKSSLVERLRIAKIKVAILQQFLKDVLFFV